MKKSENTQSNSEQKSNPREVEKRLFAGLMRTKTLPIVPDPTPSAIPDELDEEESVQLAMEAEKLRRLRVRQQAEADLLPNSSKQQKPTRKPLE